MCEQVNEALELPVGYVQVRELEVLHPLVGYMQAGEHELVELRGLPIGCMNASEYEVLDLPVGYVQVCENEVLDLPAGYKQASEHEVVELLVAASWLYVSS